MLKITAAWVGRPGSSVTIAVAMSVTGPAELAAKAFRRRLFPDSGGRGQWDPGSGVLGRWDPGSGVLGRWDPDRCVLGRWDPGSGVLGRRDPESGVLGRWDPGSGVLGRLDPGSGVLGQWDPESGVRRQWGEGSGVLERWSPVSSSRLHWCQESCGQGRWHFMLGWIGEIHLSAHIDLQPLMGENLIDRRSLLMRLFEQAQDKADTLCAQKKKIKTLGCSLYS